MSDKLEKEMKKIKPGWALAKPTESKTTLDDNREADDGYVDTGLEGDVPSNYENSLIGNPKGLSDFEVSKAPGRLG